MHTAFPIHYIKVGQSFRVPRRAAGNRFARDDKGPWSQRGLKQSPGERPRESAETRHAGPQPSRHVQMKGAAPLSGAEEQTAPAISAYAFSPACVFFVNGECMLDLTVPRHDISVGLFGSIEHGFDGGRL